jgi:hypothetical protein
MPKTDKEINMDDLEMVEVKLTIQKRNTRALDKWKGKAPAIKKSRRQAMTFSYHIFYDNTCGDQLS